MNAFQRDLILTFCLLIFSNVNAQPQIDLLEFADGFNNPLSIAHAGDERIFVVEQAGLINILDQQGNVNANPFLDISERVKSGGEQGLLGLAFHPDYANNGYFYVNYTDFDDSTHIARFSVSQSDPDVALPGSEFTILTIYQPYTNHNGGDIAFGPDEYLYFGTGDGGSGGDPQNNAQDSLSLLGKMLRIDVDNGNPYAIPEDNPFVGVSDVREEIWALGLRNPWRFSFDTQTGDLWIADVGQNQYEEIDFQAASSMGGENYVWRCYEGDHEYNTNGCLASSHYTFPVHEYSHDATGGCSVTGGYVYRADEYPGMQGHYFFADYCNDKIWTLYDDAGIWQLSNQGQYSGNNFSAFGLDVNGRLFVAGLSSGIIYEIIDTTSTGVIEKSSQNKVLMFPNPANNYLQISLPDAYSGAEMSIYSAFGKRMLDKPVYQNSKINIEKFPEGIYFLRIQFPENIYVFKFVKRH